MVEEINLQMEELSLQDKFAEMDPEQMKRLLNDPKYLDSSEAEIEKMMVNAKISLTELGFDIDKERLVQIEEEKKEEAEETELYRLLEGGLSFCR